MWISKKKLKKLENRIAALETEQLEVTRIVKRNIDSDKELVSIVKQLRDDLRISKTTNTGLAKYFTK